MTNTPADRNNTAMVGETSAMARPTTSGMLSRRTQLLRVAELFEPGLRRRRFFGFGHEDSPLVVGGWRWADTPMDPAATHEVRPPSAIRCVPVM